MKKIGKRLIAAGLILSTLLLSGCGDALVEMTEEEETAVVSYAAHVVSKYNRRQPDGICNVIKTAENAENTEEDTEIPAEENSTETAQAGGTSQTTEAVETETGTETATLNDVFALDGIDVHWTTVEVADYYTESGSVALTPGNGKQYLVLHIDMINTEDTDVSCDILSGKPSFKIDINGEKSVPAEVTILLNDFGTYQGTIAPGETVPAVLLFEVDADSVSETDEIVLKVTLDGVQSSVNLK